eukprot:scaffold1516_cov192-Alexandrium_tamarense.AAC.11
MSAEARAESPSSIRGDPRASWTFIGETGVLVTRGHASTRQHTDDRGTWLAGRRDKSQLLKLLSQWQHYTSGGSALFTSVGCSIDVLARTNST